MVINNVIGEGLMKREKFKVTIDTSIDDIYKHFCKSNNDESLDRMYEGVCKQIASLDCEEHERNILSIDCYIAYGRRQENFDGHSKSPTVTADRIVRQSIKDNKNQSPESLFGAALRQLEEHGK